MTMIPACTHYDATKLYFSHRVGATWHSHEVYDYGYESSPLDVCCSDKYMHLFDFEYSYRSGDGGTSWTRYATPATLGYAHRVVWTGTALLFFELDFTNSQILYSKSTDYGATWPAEAQAFPFTVALQVQPWFDVFADENGMIYAVYADDEASYDFRSLHYRTSSDDGANWSAPVDIATTAVGHTIQHCVVRARNDHVYVLYDDRSANGAVHDTYWLHKPSAGAWSAPAFLHTTGSGGGMVHACTTPLTLYAFLEAAASPEVHEYRVTDWDTATPTWGAPINNVWNPTGHDDYFWFMEVSPSCEEDDRALIVYSNYYEDPDDYQQLWEWQKNGTYALIVDYGTGDYSYFFAVAYSGVGRILSGQFV